MNEWFDPVRNLFDADHIARSVHLLIFGLGRVGRVFALLAALHGVRSIRAIEPDWVSQRNYAGAGTGEDAVGKPKLVEVQEELGRLSPRISFDGALVHLSAKDPTPSPILDWVRQATHIGIFLDDFAIASLLAGTFYRQRPCIYAGLMDTGLTGEAAWSLGGQTPCLESTARLSRKRGAQGGQTMMVDNMATVLVAVRMLLGLALVGHRGFERFAPFVNPRFPLAIIVNGPGGFIPFAQDRPDLPAGVKLVEVVRPDGTGPSCPTCRGYTP